MPIQGSSADIIKIAMIRIAQMLKDENYKSTMLLQVHDELIFNIVPEEKEILKKRIPEIMENILENAAIPLKVEA
jgi:DNA polymerase-1